VRRATDFLIRNWPLKVGAIILASVLYSGLVLGQNVRTWTGTLPVEGLRQPAGSTLIADLDPVKEVRYRAPLDVGVVSPNSFRATVDLSGVVATVGGPPSTVPVTLIALDSRIQVVDFQPQVVQVRLDPVTTRSMPITVDLGTVPDGLNLGPKQIDPSSVTILGASSRIDQVADVIAHIPIDASALNVDREVDLVAVDSNGNQIPNIEIDPQRARVRIAVARSLANRTLPLVPQLVGEPAPGYRITALTIAPLIVTVSGEEATITQLETAMTEPIDITGRTDDLEATVRVAVPVGVSVSGADTVRVMVTIDEVIGTRTFQVGVVLAGQEPGYAYGPRTATVGVTLGGPISALDAVDPSQLFATADVGGIFAGEPLVDLAFTPSLGLDLVAVSPDAIIVFVAALPTAPPSPSPSPPPSPGPTP
jgi:YbbR domain-containing protein